MYEVEGEVYRSGEFGFDSEVVEKREGANGYRLPTDAEWGWAARGGVRSKGGCDYSGGDDAHKVGWYSENSYGALKDLDGERRGTWGVGEKRGNELGLYDMSGNVWEWVWDRYEGEYEESSDRLTRGGSWRSPDYLARVSFADRSDGPQNTATDQGFRVAFSSGR